MSRLAHTASRGGAIALVAATLALTAGVADAPAATLPDLAVDPSGNASFDWQHVDGATQVVQGRRRSAAGTLSDGQYLSAFGQNATTPRVGVAPDGTATFVWRRFPFIIQTVSRTPGGALSEVQNLSADGQNALEPQVAVDPNGNATFVWRRSNGTNDIIQTRRRLANGTLEATQGISGAGQNASQPQVALAADGSASFVWSRFNGSVQIIQTRRRLANGTFQGVQDLSATGFAASIPQVAVDPNGNASFTWSRSNGANFVIQGRRRLADGTLEATKDLSAAGQNAGSPQVAGDPDGNASFTWSRSNGTHTIIQARRLLANGTLEVTKDLSATGQNAQLPQVAVAPDGAASFAWRRSDGTNLIAQTRRRLADESFGGVQNLSAAGADANSVGVGVDQNDNATFVWERLGVIQTRRRTSSLGATVDLSN